MKALIIKDTMSSLELVNLINVIRADEHKTELLHKSFVAKIEKRFLGEQNILPSNLSKYNVKLSNYKTKQGRNVKMYLLGQKESNLLVMSESEEVQEKLYDRWQALEIENALLKAIETKRLEDRQKARMGSLPMTDAVKELREDAGKVTKYYHYCTEYDMINRIVLGSTAKKFRKLHDICDIDAIRDFLSPVQIEGIEVLQGMNTILIEAGMDHGVRKVALNVKWNKLLDRQALIC